MAQAHGHLLAYFPLYRGGIILRSLRHEPADPFEMKAEQLFRNVPVSIDELQLALAGLPNDMKVKADPETGVLENTVDALRARTTWPPGLVITTPRKLHLKSVVKISKAT